MNINRHNYEEYFILYMDNELSAEGRREVENFVTLHPDLKDELDMLMHTQLVPDNRIVFDGKSDLMKFDIASTTTPIITLSNFDHWVVLYIDNELNEKQRSAVEKFASENLAAKKQLDLFLKAKLQPELVSFPNKESLYRREEKVRRIPVWFRIAAAAVMVLTLGVSTVLILNNNKKESIDELAKVTPGTQQGTTEKSNSNIPSTENTIQNNVETQNASTPDEGASILVKQDRNSPAKMKLSEEVIAPIQKEETQLAETVVKSNQNNLPSPDRNPNVHPSVLPPGDEVVAGNAGKNTDSKSLTPPDEIATVTKPSDEAYNIRVTANEPEVEEQTSGKKNKLRGFFRKVTRTFEKRTSIDPTDGDDRLLVGGLAIKLK